MFNKRLSSLLLVSILSGTLTTGCMQGGNSFTPSLVDEYGYEMLYKKDGKYKAREQERATLGGYETLKKVFGDSDILALGNNKFVFPEYSGIKGMETRAVYDEQSDKVLRIEFVGDYSEWKSQTDEKQTWDNFLYDFRRLGGYKFEDVLNVTTDTDVTEEVSDFIQKFLEDKGDSKHEGRTTRVIYINDNYKVYAYVDRKEKSKSKKIDKSIGIVFERLSQPTD